MEWCPEVKTYRQFISEMTWEQFARNKGYQRAEIVMVRVPIYSRIQPGSYKETKQVVYMAEPEDRHQTNVYWKNVIGTMHKNKQGEWYVINTDKAKYEVVEVKRI